MVERYNYYEFLKIIEKVSLSHPLISNFYTGRYRLNTTDDILYPAIVLTINNVSVGSQVTTIDFNLMYVDRLTEIRDNRDEIQSIGIVTITEIVNALKNCFDMDTTSPILINIFTDQFADNVAGVFTNGLSFDMPSDIGDCFWFNIKEICEKC